MHRSPCTAAPVATPAAAAATTMAIGLFALPAAQTPGTLVIPRGSAGICFPKGKSSATPPSDSYNAVRALNRGTTTTKPDKSKTRPSSGRHAPVLVSRP